MRDILLPANRLIRFRNSYLHPLQAALAARLPLAGRRVPLRANWRRRPLQLTAGLAPLRARAFAGGVVAATMTRDAMAAAASRTVTATRRRPVIALAAGMGLGMMAILRGPAAGPPPSRAPPRPARPPAPRPHPRRAADRRTARPLHARRGERAHA
jgi:hypothetical protein